MDDLTPPWLVRDDGVRLAYRKRDGVSPTVVFLPGYMSDMRGSKAEALDAWALQSGRSLLRLDYRGCGESEGDFSTATLTDWRDDVLLAIDRLTRGPLVLIGSSMGGWIMLLAALARPDRIAGLVGIAAAPDFTDWGFTQDQKMTILNEGRLEQPSPYGAPIITTRAMWQSGEAQRMLQSEIAIDCPVRLLHGQQDTDVPWHHTLHLSEKLRSANVQVTLVKDGDHRLSRPADIALLIGSVERLMGDL